MIIETKKSKKILLSVAIGLTAAICLDFGLILLAHNSGNASEQNIENIIFVPTQKQPEPPKHGTPKTTRGTGSRGNCPYKQDVPPLTALGGGGNLTQTLNARPSFWVYVPYSSTEVSTAEFTLQDGESDLYRGFVSIPANKSGIIEIKLPSTVAPLKTGKQYRWYFEISCSPETEENITAFATLTGIVKKVEISTALELELNRAENDLERIKIVAKHGMWYDTLTYLAQLRLKKQSSSLPKRLWENILSQENVGLVEIAEQPILIISSNEESK